MRKILYIVLLFIGFNASAQLGDISPWSYCDDFTPIGGGAGYTNVLSAADADIHITTNISRSAFKSLVEGASVGDVIFVDNTVTIDLTGLGSGSIQVKQGVTIASDRGVSGSNGALIFTNDMAYQGTGNAQPVFKTIGTDTRFTGFRFQGPYGGNGIHSLDSYDIRLKHGIASNYSRTEVDNMELYNWPFSAVILGEWAGAPNYFGPAQPSDGHKYHNNYVYHNRQNRYGYGINVQRAEVEVYANVFRDNRHDIASGTNGDYVSYTARCNTFLGDNISHNVDVHGVENGPGGKYFLVEYNDFHDDASNRGTNNDEHIRFTGIPSEQGIIRFNRFERVSKFADFNSTSGNDVAFQQRRVSPVSNKPANITFSDNLFNGEFPSGGGPSPTGIDGLVFTTTGTPSINVDENTTNFSAKIEPVTDEVGETYTYAKRVVGWTGPDPGFFTISNDTIYFDNGSSFTPDFEDPQDSPIPDGNNLYAFFVTVTSSSGATYDENMLFYVQDVVEVDDNSVTDIDWVIKKEIIRPGKVIDLARIFNNGSTTPDNTNVSFVSDNDLILENNGLALSNGSTVFSVVAADDTNGIIQDSKEVRVYAGSGKNKRRAIR